MEAACSIVVYCLQNLFICFLGKSEPKLLRFSKYSCLFEIGYTITDGDLNAYHFCLNEYLRMCGLNTKLVITGVLLHMSVCNKYYFMKTFLKLFNGI